MRRIFALSAMLFFCLSLGVFAQENQEEAPPKPKIIEATFSKPFAVVWKTIKTTLESTACLVELDKYSETKDGTYRGRVESVYCVLAAGVDTTKETLEKYSVRVPYIRGGAWSSARMKYTFIVTENADQTVKVLLKGEISGFEEYVTYKFHYFDSNTILEERMMAALKKALGELKE